MPARPAVCPAAWLLLAVFLVATAPAAAQNDDPATVEDLLQTLLERDAMIYDLQRRVEVLEQRAGIVPTPAPPLSSTAEESEAPADEAKEPKSTP